MSEPFFVEKGVEPTEEMLVEALGDSYDLFAELVDLQRNSHLEWRFVNMKET
jgi:hypothetical protein